MQPRDELINLENEWYAALLAPIEERASSVEKLRAILADGYINTVSEGTILKKDGDIANFGSGRYVERSLKLTGEMKVYPEDDSNAVSAVVTGADEVEATYDSVDVSGSYHWTDFWVKDGNGAWRCVASHGSRDTPPPVLAKVHMQPRDELIKLEKEWYAALRAPIAESVEKLRAILADGYINTVSEGTILEKNDDIANFESGRYVVRSLKLKEDMKVRPEDDPNAVSAVVFGADEVEASFDGRDVSGSYRWTDTWVKDATGAWRCVASHGSRTTSPPALAQ